MGLRRSWAFLPPFIPARRSDRRTAEGRDRRKRTPLPCCCSDNEKKTGWKTTIIKKGVPKIIDIYNFFSLTTCDRMCSVVFFLFGDFMRDIWDKRQEGKRKKEKKASSFLSDTRKRKRDTAVHFLLLFPPVPCFSFFSLPFLAGRHVCGRKSAVGGGGRGHFFPDMT